jgi:hypothetical protein
MDLLEDLIGVDHSRVFNFFIEGLSEVSNKKPCNQMFYVASILAHYAETSPFDPEHILFLDPGVVFNEIIFLKTDDPKILKIYGSHIILFAGFFRDQIKGRYNVSWYDELGQGLYYKAGLYGSLQERNFFKGLSETLPSWTSRCCKLSRYLREKRLLLR